MNLVIDLTAYTIFFSEKVMCGEVVKELCHDF